MAWFRDIGRRIILKSRHRHRQTERSIQAKLGLLLEAEQLSSESLKNVHEEYLSNLLMHAYKHVPYYRHIFNSSGLIDANGKLELGSFNELPLLDKRTIRERSDDLKSDILINSEISFDTSGGSTGEPVKLIQDKNYLDWLMAVKFNYDRWSGYIPGTGRALLWGSERDLFAGGLSYKVRLMRWLNNELWMNTFCLTPEKINSYVDKINTLRPTQILAYAESAYEFAKYIDQHDLKIYSPRSVMTSAGTLYPHMRAKIEQIFQAPVFNRYGSREVGDIACECEYHNGLHVCPLTHHVEVLRSDGAPVEVGEVGEVVVTLLSNYAMPLIRYRIGDLAVRGQNTCKCGRKWPILEKITGRVTDTFRTRDGAQVHGEYFTHLFYFKEWVEKFQVIQESFDHVKVLIVLSDKAEAQEHYVADLEDTSKKIRVVLGDSCQIEYDYVDVIAPAASGKYRYTISKIDATAI